MLRANSGMSQTEVADAIGVNRTTYCKIEKTGEIKKSNTLKALAKTFEVSLAYLTQNDDQIIDIINEPIPIDPIVGVKKLKQTFPYLLTSEEISIIEKYRSLSPEKKDFYEDFIKKLSEL